MKKLLVLFLIINIFFIVSCGNKTVEETIVSEVIVEEAPVINVKESLEKEFIEKIDSDIRPVAVMIDNDSKEARPQIGLESAYVVYEIIVEGGATRFMALYKDKDINKVGPVRSSRHYFLDYALEHDAIYVHAGWSPQASGDISRLDVKNINGILGEDGKIFWRDKTYDRSWHNLYTGIDKAYDMAVAIKKYNDTTSVKHLKYYDTDTEIESDKEANEIRLTYSHMYNVRYEYDFQSKLYKRFIDSIEHMSQTGECLTAKNIIIYKVANYSLNDGDNVGRQNIKNIGSGTGYYITNGKVIDIKWSKSSRKAKTVYTTVDGSELLLNPGNTYIQIVPMNSDVEIE